MKNDKSKIPVAPILMEDDLIETCKSASSNDCTGLIQRGDLDEYEIESYKEIYDFAPIKKEDIE